MTAGIDWLAAERSVSGERASGTSRDARVRVLVDEHWAFVGRLLRHMGVRADLDDALQQVFMTLVAKLDQVTPGKERAFLAGCAVHIAARHRRRMGLWRRLFGQEEAERIELTSADDPERAAHERRQLERLDVALAAMPSDARSVFLLHEVEELTMAEIAEALAIPPGTVASRLRRARSILKERLPR